MTFAIAAAGTGGHVFPGLAVGEALVARGVPRSDILYLGGNRLEAEVYPREGFPFLGVELRGLSRSFTAGNLGIPAVVWRATRKMAATFDERGVRAVLGVGGYVTVPASLAARKASARLAIAEQNAEAGLANRLCSRLAVRVFGGFPETRKLPRAEWVGNPVRAGLAGFDRQSLRPAALARYRLSPEMPVVGVFGGSLGAGVINRAVRQMATSWDGPRIQVLHLAGPNHADGLPADAAAFEWRVLGFEDRMEDFYAASDLVVARAGGAVAELTVTRTPAILVPGSFGSGRHQHANARALEAGGAAVVVEESRLGSLGVLVTSLLEDRERLKGMAAAAAALARPDAAAAIARALEEMHA